MCTLIENEKKKENIIYRGVKRETVIGGVSKKQIEIKTPRKYNYFLKKHRIINIFQKNLLDN